MTQPFGQPQSWQSGQPVYGNQFQQFAQPQQPQQAYMPPAPGVNTGGAQPTNHQHAPSWDDAEDPSGFGGLFARPRHLEGRVVIYMPKRVDERARDLQGNAKSTPNIHGDLLVVDGGPIEFGDKQRSGGIVERPCTHRVNAPAFFSNVIVGEQQIALALQRATPPFGNGLMVGVIVRGQKGNQPYLLQTLERDDPRREAARQLYDAWRSGAWKSPEPEPIQVVPGSAAQSTAAAGQWSQPQNMGGATVTTWNGQQAPQNGPQGFSGGQAAQWGQQPQFGQQQPAQGPQQVAQTPPGFSIDQPAPGWDPGMWAQVPEVNRAQIWQAVFAQQAAPTGQPNPGATSGPTGF